MKNKQLANSFSSTSSRCSVCSESLSRIGKSKKVCSSCHQIVCEKCAKHKTYDEKLRKKVRICDVCISDTVKVNIKASFADQLSFSNLEQEQLKEQLKEEQEKAHNAIIQKHQAQENYHLTIESDREEELKLLSQIEQIENGNLERKQESNKLRKQIDQLKEQNAKFEKENNLMSEEILKISDLQKRDAQKVTQLETLIQQQRSENEKVKNSTSETDKHRNSELNTQDLRAQIKDLENMVKSLQKENKTLNAEISQNKNKRKNPEYSNNPSVIKRLEDIIAQQENEIEQLQKELEDTQTFTDAKE